MDDLYDMYMDMKSKKKLLLWLIKLGLCETATIISAQPSLTITPLRDFIELYWRYPHYDTWDVFYTKWDD